MIFLLYIVQCRYVLLQERKVQYGSGGDGREITGIVEDTKLPHDVTLS